RAAGLVEHEALDRRPGASELRPLARPRATRGAAVPIVLVSVVAFLAGIDHPVAAARELAVVASVPALEVAVVTGLPGVETPVAAAAPAGAEAPRLAVRLREQAAADDGTVLWDGRGETHVTDRAARAPSDRELPGASVLLLETREHLGAAALDGHAAAGDDDRVVARGATRAGDERGLSLREPVASRAHLGAGRVRNQGEGEDTEEKRDRAAAGHGSLSSAPNLGAAVPCGQ